MHSFRAALFRLLLAFPMLTAMLVGSSTDAAPDVRPHLANYYDDWRRATDHLLSHNESDAFARLTDDAERELFIHRFWSARCPVAGECLALVRWYRRFGEARRRFRDLASDRAGAFMVAGAPARTLGFGGCGRDVRRLEIWSYSELQKHVLGIHGVAADNDGGFHLVFYEPQGSIPGRFRHWSPGIGPDALAHRRPGMAERDLDDLVAAAVTRPCVPATLGEMRQVKAALHSAWGPGELRDEVGAPMPTAGWLESFERELGDLHAVRQAAFAAAPIEIDYSGLYQRYTLVRGRLRVPSTSFATNADGLLFDRLEVLGDIWQNGRLVEPFRFVHLVAGPAPDEIVVLDFYRRLRPGLYVVDLRVEDGRGRALRRERREIQVPRASQPAAPPAGFRQGLAGLLRPEVGVLTTFPSVKLLVSGDELMAGEVEIAAVTGGGPIERVDFLLDARAMGSDDTPPYAAALELGPAPQAQVLEAVAYDPAGREIARDRAELNVAAPRLEVRILEPRRGGRGLVGDEIRVRVDVPLDEEIERLELHLGEKRFAVLHEPPFVHPLPSAARHPGATFLRAEAVLESGERSEAVVLLGDRALEEIDVELVELYASVLDSRGRPALGLRQEGFHVFEDGEEQEILRFDRVENLPLHVLLMMDVSQSMRDRVTIAIESARRFFSQVVTPKDQAGLLAFNHGIDFVVPFTANVARLDAGASGLSAWGSTRLYDSLIYALYSFAGRRGKKAVVVLSDGEDIDSDFYFRHVLEHTLRSGVAIYPIGLDLRHQETEDELQRLAEESGGRFFEIETVSELERVYRQIELDLRSQYLLVYRPAEKDRTHFRRVEVEVERQGVAVRTIQGYYP